MFSSFYTSANFIHKVQAIVASISVNIVALFTSRCVDVSSGRYARIEARSFFGFFAGKTLLVSLISKSRVFKSMLLIAKKLKIFNVIILTIAVFMMDFLVFSKRSTKMLRHYVSVLKSRYSIDFNHYITIGIKCTSSRFSYSSYRGIAMLLHSLVMKTAKTISKIFSPASLYFTQPLAIIVQRIHIATIGLYGEIRKVLLSYFFIFQL